VPVCGIGTDGGAVLVTDVGGVDGGVAVGTATAPGVGTKGTVVEGTAVVAVTGSDAEPP
jgi:hypothetical protein